MPTMGGGAYPGPADPMPARGGGREIVSRVYDVFVRDRQTGTTQLVSVSSAGEQGNFESLRPGISADGRFVTFDSGATNLAPPVNPGDAVFVHDRLTGTTELASISSAGAAGNGASLLPAISPGGRFVAFQSGATNLVPGDTNGLFDSFVHDRQSGTTQLVSVSSPGEQGNSNSFSFNTALSSKGRFVTFELMHPIWSG